MAQVGLLTLLIAAGGSVIVRPEHIWTAHALEVQVQELDGGAMMFRAVEKLLPPAATPDLQPIAKRKHNPAAIVPRDLKGGKPGETSMDRDARVRDYMISHPRATNREVVKALGVPVNLVTQVAKSIDQKAARGRRETFLPPQQFTPSDKPPDTPDARLAAISDADKAAIAARYGVTFR